MALGAALVDRARILSEEPVGPRIEGRTRTAITHGNWFRARLTITSAEEDADPANGRPQVTEVVELLFGLRDSAGDTVEINARDRVEVDSKQLGRDIFEVVGTEPMRRRRSLLGGIARLVRPEEGG